jgi:molybdate transport system permease protein
VIRSRVPVAFLALALIGVGLVTLPLAGLLVRAPWSALAPSLSGAGASTAFRLSVVVSLAATGISVTLGVPIAWLLARSALPGRAVLRALVVLPVVLPPVVRGGLVGRLLYRWLGLQLTFTTAGAIVAATFVSMPLVVLATEAGLRSLDERYELAASAFGARPWTVLRRVTLPMLLPNLVAGTVLAWARALGEFGATITFAGSLPGRTQTLPLAVYEARQTDPGGAILLSLILVVLSVGVLVALGDRITQAR